jgi:predicted O-methyltransferase YrrM
MAGNWFPLAKRPRVESFPAIVRSVHGDSLSYLEEAALNDLFQTVQVLEKQAREGILIEAGCAFGGSAIVIAAAKSKLRPLYVYDVFGMPPPVTEDDGPDGFERYSVIKSGQSEGIDGNQYYGYVSNLLERVTDNFRKHGVPVELNSVQQVKGLVQETLWVQEPVSLAHIDCDRYESVQTCLHRIEPHLVRKGVLVIDDYDSKSGCRKAVDEYFIDKAATYDFVRKSRLHIIRKEKAVALRCEKQPL